MILSVGTDAKSENHEYDRSIESAAIKKVQEKFKGDLRGTIGPDVQGSFYTMQKKPSVDDQKTSGINSLEDRRNPASGLKPMVYNAYLPIDSVVTGSINRPDRKVVWEMFDKDGNLLNPYPGN